MAKMKAARLFGPGDLRIIETSIPEVGTNDVLCKVERAGVCRTDYAIYSGEFSFVKKGSITFPKTLGHEWSATARTPNTSSCRNGICSIYRIQ